MAEQVNEHMITTVPGVVEAPNSDPSVEQVLITEAPKGAEVVGKTIAHANITIVDSGAQTIPIRFGGEPIRIASKDFRGDPSRVLNHPSNIDPTLVRRA